MTESSFAGTLPAAQRARATVSGKAIRFAPVGEKLQSERKVLKKRMPYTYSGSRDRKVTMFGKEDFLAPLYEKYGSRFLQYRKEWDRCRGDLEYLPDFPLFLDVEPEYRCNLRCITCPHALGKRNPSYHTDVMPLEMFEGICEEAARYGMPAISVSNNNEGLMQKHLFEYIDLAASYGMMDIFLGTNAHLLTKEVSEKILQSELSRLLISIDAAGSDVYFKMRRSKKYDIVVSNVRRFHAMRARHKAKLPLIRVSMVVTSINEHEAENFKQIWKDIADIVSLQRYLPPVVGANARDRLIPKRRDEIENKICSALWQRMTIRANGDVISCCHLSNKLKVGNIAQQSVYDIWHGEEMNHLRAIHLAGDYHRIDVCASCMD